MRFSDVEQKREGAPCRFLRIRYSMTAQAAMALMEPEPLDGLRILPRAFDQRGEPGDRTRIVLLDRKDFRYVDGRFAWA